MALTLKGQPIANSISPMKHPSESKPIKTLFYFYFGNGDLAALIFNNVEKTLFCLIFC
jgi:hypothetical protein